MIAKILSSIVLVSSIVFQSCERTEVPFSEVNTSTEYNFGDTLKVSKNIDFAIKVNGKLLNSENKKEIDSNLYVIGINNLEFSFKVDGKTKNIRRKIIVYPKSEPAKIGFSVIKSYNHGKDIYTEGLEEYKNEIFESGGEYKKSKLIKYPKTNQEDRKQYHYTDDIFAEGITILNDTLYGLSYREHKIFRFNPESLELIDVKKSPIDFEGWGLTNDGRNLIMSDGTNNIYYLNPKDYSISKILQVYSNKGKVVYVNELEYVDGVIYANVFMQDIIIVIDAKTGAVLASLDFSDISAKHKNHGVLNGIAKLDNGNFLITGKHWDKMYEVKIDKLN